jgi:hypothetical protein
MSTKQQTRSLMRFFSQRMLSDFEIETQDFALLCMIASAHGLSPWPMGIDHQDDPAGLLTFH